MAGTVSTGKDFMTAVRERRTIYGLGKESPIPHDRIVQIIEESVKHTPSAFNSQSARVVVLFGEQHNKLWDLTKETLRAIVKGDFQSTEQKMNGFRSGCGTILYFEDMAVVEGLQAQFASYKEHFPNWSMQSNGMLQMVIWTALEREGLGANLQHYNPLIDEKVREAWKLPDTWKLIAQMPFGKPTAPPGEKQFKPIEERMKVFK